MQIVVAAWNNGNPTPEFNNAAQVGLSFSWMYSKVCILFFGVPLLIVGVLQIWNHEFFWESMSPNGGGKITGLGITDKACFGASYVQWFDWSALQCNAGEPSGELKAAIDKSFGSFEEFKKQFSAAGATQFGMGTAALL